MQTTEYGKQALRFLACTGICAILAGCGPKEELILSATDKADANTVQEQEGEVPEQTTEDVAGAATERSVPAKQISVHVCGAVNRAGVYLVPEDARVIDAVRAAGGFSSDADEEALNQAAFLVDGCKLRIPCLGEADPESQGAVPPVMTVGQESQPADSLVVLADGISEQDGKVNLNTASEEELCTLNGIGPKRASDIIRYREEHGAFANIEEVMNVSGIKQSLFAKIKGYIRV